MVWLYDNPSFIPSFFPTGLLVIILVAVAALWLVCKPKLALAFLLFSLVAGQLIRLPLSDLGGGILVSDAAVVIVLISALKPMVHLRSVPWANQFLLFIFWSLFTLIIRFPDLGLNSSLVSLAYWLRLSVHLLLVPALILLLRDKRLRRFGKNGLTLAGIMLIIFGFTQLFLLPDLAVLGGLHPALPFLSLAERWDPHQWRMVATWLDPNFLGAFFVVMLPNIFVWRRHWLFAAMAAALLATQSRSAWVAILLSSLLFSPLLLTMVLKQDSSPSKGRRRMRRVIAAVTFTVIVFSLFVLAGILFWPRIAGLITIGPTVQLRLNSASQAWQVIQDHPLLGVGYNAYQFSARQYGFISDFSIHSRAGADNSLLLLWATTGWMGLMLFILPWVNLADRLATRVFRHFSWTSLAALFSLAAWFIHGQFINSLMYSHLIITIAIILAVTFNEPGNSNQ